VACASCESNSREFPAEIAIHLEGLHSLVKPPLIVFRKLSICVKCGNVQFVVPEEALRALQKQ
jgi:hypothetical protein